MPTDTDILKLDYFDLLLLDGKDAVFEVDGGASVTCDKYRFTIPREKLGFTEVEFEDGKRIKDGDVPKPQALTDDQKFYARGYLRLMMITADHWVVMFMAPPEIACMLRAGSHKETLDLL
jgi:hypothetical protein